MWRLSVTEQWVGEWNGALLAVCGWIYLCEDYSRKAQWNDWVDLWSGMKKALMQCGAEVGEMNWTQWSEGWPRSEARTASPETEWVKRMNLPQAHGNKTRPIFFHFNHWWVVGKYWGFSGSVAGQSVDFVRLLYIIWL